MQVVAVVRKVYNKNSDPRLGALVPEYNEEGELMLVWVELPFSEDFRHLEFPSLPPASAEQTELMDQLVDNMMLSNEEADVFPVDQIVNPSHQHQYEQLTHRALNPGRILPGPSHHVLNSLSPPEEVFRCAEPLFKRMKELFVTKIIEDPKKRKLSDQEEGVDSKKRRTEGEDQVTHVGRISPAEDFRYLLAHRVSSNITLDGLALQLETVLVNLLGSPFSSSLTSKIISCLAVLREASCAEQRPDLYNGVIRRLKAALAEQDKGRIWLEVVEANLGLIAHSEVAGGVQEAEADYFLAPPDSNVPANL